MRKDVIEVTRELIQIESTNPGAGEGQVEDYIVRYLSGSGADIRLDEVLPGRWNVVATVNGNASGPMLILICHMDTVVTGTDWKRDPFAAIIENGRLYGRGACDMKSGLACALSVFRDTAEKQKRGEISLLRPLRLICTVDEEGDMRGVERAIELKKVQEEDWVIDLEPTDGQIQMAHKGRFWLEVNIQGKTAHASKPQEGADAIAGAAEWIREMRDAFAKLPEDKGLGHSTITFGQIQGGYQPYVVPDQCKLWVDCRLVPPVDDKMAEKIAVKAACSAENAVRGIHITWKITGNRPYIEKNGKSELLDAVRNAVRTATGKVVKESPFPGYTDTAVIAGRLQNRNCLSYGPGSLKYAHKPDEFVELEDIKRCEKVLQHLVEICLKK